jgi:hypothetical protein
MASIISSSQRSVSSVLDSVAVTAEVTTQLITTAARTVDMLDIKAQAMHQSVKENAVISLSVNQEDTICERAMEITLRKEQRHRSMQLTETFTRTDVYNATIEQIRKALTDAATKAGTSEAVPA